MSDSIYTIQPSRLDWDPDDTRKVSEGGSLLGEGTFGSVYRGKYNHITVAIKVIKHRSDGQSTGRIAAEQQHAREVRRLRELSFKHIVQCYGISKSPMSSDVLIVTECLEGGSLYQSLQQARVVDARLSDLSFLTIASHIAKGLSYVHDSGFIHGDMKPHNVLLTGSIIIDAEAHIADFPPYVEAKIADFGMSKRLQGGPGSDLLISAVEFGNQAFGTFAYMAPEIFSGAMHLDNEELKRVDVYAFGVVLYEMLTGISPWQYEGVTNPMHLYNLVCGEQKRPAWGPRSDVIRPEHKRMIEMCWHQDNMRRPQIGDLIKQLDTWIEECKKAPRASRGSSSQREPVSIKAEPAVRTVVVDDHEVLGDASDISRRVESISVSDSNSAQERNMREHAANQKVKADSISSGEHGSTGSPRYWERNSHAKPRLVVTSDQNYDLGDSVDVPPPVKKSHGSSNSSSDSDSRSGNLQDFSDLAGVNVTRVVTQVIKQPEVPQLELFGGKQSPGLNNNSWWDAVARQNKVNPSTKPGPTGGSNVSEVLPTIVQSEQSPMATPAKANASSGKSSPPQVSNALGPERNSANQVQISSQPPNPVQGAFPNKNQNHVPTVGVSDEQKFPDLAGQAPLVTLVPQNVTPQAVTRALQLSDGSQQILQWWKEGHTIAIAAAFAREDSRSGAPDRFALISDLLRQTADAPEGVRKPAVAKDLCIAMGNISRGATMERAKALRAIPITLKILRAFSCVVTVYGAACYALANLLKRSNDLPDDQARKDITGWLSHAISFNLNGGPPPPRVPTLAYTTASAARNFVWMKDANASVFLSPGDGGHASAVELLLDSMLWFRLNPTVAEACLSAFAALAYYPRHRIALVRENFVSAACKVMCPERPARDTNPTVLSMGLATLGILVSGPASPDETKVISSAFQDEGGVRCVVKVLGDAVRTRSFSVMEDSLSALASIARFDRALGEFVVHSGGVGPVIQAVWCAVTIPESVTVRCAEMMCGVAAVLSHHVVAANTMRQSNLAEPLSKLVTRFSHEPRVAAPGSQAISRVRLT